MRTSVLALAGLLALPAAAAAQEPVPPGQLPSARFAVTPFVGLRVPYNSGDAYLYTPEGAQYIVQEERGGGAVVGAEVQARVRGPVSLLGSVGYTDSGSTAIALVSGDNGSVIPLRMDNPATWLGRVAVAYRLPEPSRDNRRFRPAGYVLAGPAMVRMDHHDDDALGADLSGASSHWALNLGVHAATTLGSPRLALHFGLEDYLTFWDTERLAAREAAAYGFLFGPGTEVDIDYSASNLVLLRAGISFRL
ncbi:MAG TPA: hypothetical protein VHG51_16875 [Longimicrobiaceae bacterium]|nr:hypothetical protein [Longimicrobiaceae bacterium]